MAEDSATHYEMITDLWKYFMGDNFHFGYFETEGTALDQATEAMIEKMLEPCEISEGSRVLDVGCGIGAPAFFIYERYRCTIDGITNSERGVNIANKASREKGYDKNVRFKVADGINNGFPAGTFDLVWIMEASHCIEDKAALFQECYRVLKGGGMLAMCDLISLKSLPFLKGWLYFFANLKEALFAPKVWGPAYIPSMGTLCDCMVGAGFSKVEVIDITAKVRPTLRHWRENALRFRDGEASEFNRRNADEFARGCENLEKSFQDGFMGYGMLFAHKEG
jgi:cyclopropane fatty-acyl-phospholipid synthase-like methyltransferase